MNALNSQVRSDATETPDNKGDSPASEMTSEILPACFLLGIIAGFSAFVAFGQAVLPAMIAAVIGALVGLFFACEGGSPTTSDGMREIRR